eukprot:CAMPEP_0113969426 /NCGR_PEP_ID=MMETSP0011_2-20120614/10313_1 /TAXON_ID=101924 /ORGANISM="Rhodosorus marinus" /LENGTH=58 /DNA_ID=CAMNT_0000983087 /DNA_START=237 /DNA_END=413 /DNA_ORIENTATION=+ /assembly_acc=CAM_ASM_000156
MTRRWQSNMVRRHASPAWSEAGGTLRAAATGDYNGGILGPKDFLGLFSASIVMLFSRS